MKKILFMALFIVGCSSNNNYFTAKNITVNYSDCSNMPLPNLKVCLDSVNDGRCPSDMVCVWGGNASVRLTLKSTKKRKTFTLNTHSNFQQDTLIDGMLIKLLSVTPYPKGDEIDMAKYVIELEVTNQ
ncbi:hypothetical protein [Jejuia pallidilutea]|nr:hypothetical protein [Jejuia pallidilutea]